MFKKIIVSLLQVKFIRFAISGSIATLVDIVLLYILTEFAGVWYLLSSVFSFIIGSLVHFLISRWWVFGDKEKGLFKQYISFSLIHLGGLIINTTTLYIFVEYFHVYYILAKVLTVFFGVLWTFWANRKFTFIQSPTTVSAQDIECLICKSQEINLLYPSTLTNRRDFYSIAHGQVGQHGDLYKCQECGLVFVNDQELTNLLVASYDSGFFDKTYEQELAGRKKSAARILKHIQKITPSGKLFDVGCYTGIFLSVAQELGYDAFGLEVSKQAVETAKNKGLNNIQHGFLSHHKEFYEDEYFDVITAIDFIEHLKDPQELIKFAYDKLKPGGQLVIFTPNFSSSLSKLYKDKWHAILPHHLYYFSYHNLKRLLAEYGFEIVKRKTHARHFSTSYLLKRIQGINKNLYKILNSTTKILGWRHKIWPVNFYDQLLIFAKKK